MEPAETLRPNSPEITEPHKSKKPLRQPTKLPEKYELFLVYTVIWLVYLF